MRLFIVTGYCRLTGPGRQYVRAESAEDAIEGYCLEHGMDRSLCRAEEILELRPEVAA